MGWMGRNGMDETHNDDGERRGLGRMSRRGVLGLGALAATAAAVSVLPHAAPAAAQGPGGKSGGGPTDQDDPSIAEMQALMAAGKLNSVALVNQYLNRIRKIDKSGPSLNSVIELNPDAPAIARELDAERKRSGPRGPLHGIPILLKDNVDTGDKMQTTAGSWALYGTPAPQDSTTAARLRAAGAVILGKTNLTEFANFRSWWLPAAGAGEAGRRATRTCWTAIPSVRARGLPWLYRRNSPRLPSGRRPMGPSSARLPSTASSASSQR